MAVSPGTLLPILHEAEWSGSNLAACRPLVECEGDYLPLVAFTEDSPERRVTWTRAALQEATRYLVDLEDEAIRNLVRREIGLRPRADGSLVAIDEYASSMLASEAELERVRAALGSDAILLAAPTRGLLVALARPAAGDAGLSRFAREAFSTALEARITPHVFSWDGTKLDVHVERVRDEVVSRLDERAYDDDAEELTLELVGDAGPQVVRVLRRMLATGRHDDGRAVAAITLIVDHQDSERELAHAFAADELVIRLRPPRLEEKLP